MTSRLNRIWGFMSPAQRQRVLDSEKTAARRLCDCCLEKWDPLKTKFQDRIALDGEHYTEYVKSLMAFPDEAVLFTGSKHIREQVRHSPGGHWSYANRTLPALTWMDTWRGHTKGVVVFSTDVPIPTLLWDYQTISSGTPMEMFTMRQGIRRSTGTVLVGGLGLGWFLRLVAAKKSVKRVIVVEKSQDLLDWYGRELCARISGESDTPIEVICDDVWEHVGKHGVDVRHMLDIWEGYPTCLYDLDKKQRVLIEGVKHFWGWGLLAESSI